MANFRPHISVVIPVYGCKECLHELYHRLIQVLPTINPEFEVILINDACPQGSWAVIQELTEKDNRIKGINLSRNFGQLKAILAGLDCASGDYIVVMDGDLQDQPEDIVKLYTKIKEGFDVVFGRRQNRKDCLSKRILSAGFYKIYDYFTDGDFDYTIGNFSISRQIVINNYRRIREQNRSFTLFIKWMGFNQTAINVEHAERTYGRSSYDLRKRWNLAKNIIIAQSNKPLRFSISFGITVSISSFIYALYLTIRYYYSNITVTGWTSLIVSLFFLSGLVLMNIGIVGLYIGKIFDETKGRPIYIVKDVINCQTERED